MNGKKRKKSQKQKAKEKLWKAVSEFVRLNESDINDYCRCVTCGEPIHSKYQTDAGHFIPKAKGNAIYFDMRGIHAQCKHCNGFMEGNVVEYFIYMEEKYGRDVIEHLRYLSKLTVHWYESDFLAMLEESDGWIKELEERRRNGNYEPMRVNFKILEEL